MKRADINLYIPSDKFPMKIFYSMEMPEHENSDLIVDEEHSTGITFYIIPKIPDDESGLNN